MLNWQCWEGQGKVPAGSLGCSAASLCHLKCLSEEQTKHLRSVLDRHLHSFCSWDLLWVPAFGSHSCCSQNFVFIDIYGFFW